MPADQTPLEWTNYRTDPSPELEDFESSIKIPLGYKVTPRTGDAAPDLAKNLASTLAESNSPEVRSSVARQITEILSGDGIGTLTVMAPLFKHPSREIRHLAFATVGELTNLEPQPKLDAIKNLLDEVVLPEYVTDALFGVMHVDYSGTDDLGIEDRFAVAAPYVTNADAEVRAMAIGVLFKHPELVKGNYFDRLCNLFEDILNQGIVEHVDPQVEADVLQALTTARGCNAANSALD